MSELNAKHIQTAADLQEKHLNNQQEEGIYPPVSRWGSLWAKKEGTAFQVFTTF